MKTVSRLLLVALAMSLASCVTMPERQRLMLGGRYEELTRRFDVDPASPVPIKTSDLFPVCVAYSKLKRYDKLFPCLDRLERNFKNGDKAYLDLAEMVRDNPTLGSFVNMRTGQERAAILYDVSEYAYLMRAEAFIELGDYPRAVA
ncbi:MAG: hypothetical protein FJ272_19055, partial [Planctomycetes bacterium]|nr:hypothetical protein [Planctomycetota bacterium]